MLFRSQENETHVLYAEIDQGAVLRKQFFRGQCFISTDSVMIRRRILDDVGLFDESLRVCEDSDLWLRIMTRFGFGYIPEPLVWIRRSIRRWEQIGPQLDHHFAMSARLYAKHRYAFGKGLRGWVIWHAGRGFVLRYQAMQFVGEGRRGRALAILLQGIVTWPFVAPGLTMRCAARGFLGDPIYKAVGRLFQPGKSAVKWLLSVARHQTGRACNSAKKA